jgi:hypothetical protein
MWNWVGLLAVTVIFEAVWFLSLPILPFAYQLPFEVVVAWATAGVIVPPLVAITVALVGRRKARQLSPERDYD